MFSSFIVKIPTGESGSLMCFGKNPGSAVLLPDEDFRETVIWEPNGNIDLKLKS